MQFLVASGHWTKPGSIEISVVREYRFQLFLEAWNSLSEAIPTVDTI